MGLVGSYQQDTAVKMPNRHLEGLETRVIDLKFFSIEATVGDVKMDNHLVRKCIERKSAEKKPGATFLFWEEKVEEGAEGRTKCPKGWKKQQGSRTRNQRLDGASFKGRA